MAVSATRMEAWALRCVELYLQRVGLNLRSDRIRACDVKLGGRMDLYLRPGHSELEGTSPKNVGASMPDHLCSSTHDGLELHSGLNAVPVTCGATSQEPAPQQPVAQDLAPQEAGGTRTHPLDALLCTETVIWELCSFAAWLCTRIVYMKTVREGCKCHPADKCYTLAGSTFAERTAASLKLVGDTPLHDAAERYPADALCSVM